MSSLKKLALLCVAAVVVVSAESFQKVTLSSWPSSEELSKDELMEAIKDVREADELGALLFRVKDKEEAELAAGVSVEELVDMHSVEPIDCTEARSLRRAKVCDSLTSRPSYFVQMAMLRSYCKDLDAKVEAVCRPDERAEA